MGSAMYHEGIERYLFLTASMLFEAPNPWGPWVQVANILNYGDDPEWKGGYMPGIITKGAGADFFYFTFAGQSNIIRYNLYVGKIAFELRSEIEAHASANVTVGEALLKVKFWGSCVSSKGENISYRWYFGDGEKSEEQNPIHIYESPTHDSYRAMLTVTDEQGRQGFDIVEITVPFCDLALCNPKTFTSCVSGLQVRYYELTTRFGENMTDFSILFEFCSDTVSQINYIHTTDYFV